MMVSGGRIQGRPMPKFDKSHLSLLEQLEFNTVAEGLINKMKETVVARRLHHLPSKYPLLTIVLGFSCDAASTNLSAIGECVKHYVRWFVKGFCEPCLPIPIRSQES